MRIGYYGFSDEADVDVLVPPPASVDYQPETLPESILTTSGLVELRRHTTRSSYRMTLRWSDIPERDLARLAVIPPSEVVTLITERGREEFVVIDEPVRAMKAGVTDFDGSMLYTATLNAYPVSKSAASQNLRLRQGSVLDSFQVSKAPVALNWDSPTPPGPDPANYSIIRSSARSGLPPTVNVGEGIRFTFDAMSTDYGRVQYFDVTGDGRIELTNLSPNIYSGWFGHKLNAVSLETGVLRRYPFSILDDFTVNFVSWHDASLVDGSVIRAQENNALLSINYTDGEMQVSYNINGSVQSSVFPASPSDYHVLGVQRNNGNLLVYFNGDSQSVTSVVTSAPSGLEDAVILGGGSLYLDDVLFANSDNIDLVATYTWLTGEEVLGAV